MVSRDGAIGEDTHACAASTLSSVHQIINFHVQLCFLLSCCEERASVWKRGIERGEDGCRTVASSA